MSNKEEIKDNNQKAELKSLMKGNFKKKDSSTNLL